MRAVGHLFFYPHSPKSVPPVQKFPKQSFVLEARIHHLACHLALLLTCPQWCTKQIMLEFFREIRRAEYKRPGSLFASCLPPTTAQRRFAEELCLSFLIDLILEDYSVKISRNSSLPKVSWNSASACSFVSMIRRHRLGLSWRSSC